MLLVHGKKKLNEWWWLKNGKYKKKTYWGLEMQMHLEPVHLPRATAPATSAAAVSVVVDDGGGL